MRHFCKGIVPAVALAGSVWAAEPNAKTSAVYANGRTPGPSSSDRVTATVRARLAGDPQLNGAAISVAISRTGLVTLVGDVPSVTAKSEAAALARDTPGVVGVDDELRLDVSSPDAPVPP